MITSPNYPALFVALMSSLTTAHMRAAQMAASTAPVITPAGVNRVDELLTQPAQSPTLLTATCETDKQIAISLS